MIGIDGCRGGWVGVALRRGAVHGTAFGETVADLVSELGEAAVVAIDIPIGMPVAGERRCDLLAREALGSRWSTVFMTPPESAMRAPTYPRALAAAKRLNDGKGISKQAYGLRARVLEVEQFTATAKSVSGTANNPRAITPPIIAEVHPELSFAAMNNGKPLRPKRTFGGVAERVGLLSANGIELGPELPERVASAPTDDVLDACAVAWSAERILRGEAVVVPGDAGSDESTISF